MEVLSSFLRASFSAVSFSSLLIVFLLGVVVYHLASPRGHPSFPPGPRGFPILGNVFDFPLENEWQIYTQWAREYGPIVSVHVLGQRVVVLNTLELIRETYESRSAIYSDRPFAPMLNLMGYAPWLVGMLQPGRQWNMCRRVLAQGFNQPVAQKWNSCYSQEVHRLLGKLLDDPENFFRHVDRAVAGCFMTILYGHRVPTYGKDDFLALHERSLHDTSRAITSGVYLVNLFPSFRHIPDWMVGGGFQREAKQAFVTAQRVLHEPVEMVKQNIANGIEAPSFVSSLLEEEYDEFVIKQSAATSYNAAVTGSKSVLLTSILVMTLFPEAQRKAQEEIDGVIGNGRLPHLNDRDSLPYTEAFVKELYRWAPPAPIGLPRHLARDDTIGEYFIPAGSVIMTNIWAILHDETQYPNPFDFVPERHLDHDGSCPDPFAQNFGFGKSRPDGRICPGRHLVDAFVWLTVVSILATFKIEKQGGTMAEGNETSPHVKYTSGLFSAPKPFKSNITPRYGASELIRQENQTLPSSDP